MLNITNDSHNKTYSHYRGLKLYSNTAGLAVLGFILIQNILSIPIYWIESIYVLYVYNMTFSLAINSLFTIIGLGVSFGLAYAFEKKFTRREILPFFKPEKDSGAALLIVAGFGACLLANYATYYFSAFFQAVFHLEFTAPEFPLPGDPLGLTVYVVRLALVPALFEEFAVRGVVMQPLRKYGDRFAILMSSLVFALMHGNMVQIPFAFIAGLFIGYAVIKTGSLWTGIAIHFLNNFLSAVQAYLISNFSAEDIGGVLAAITMLTFIAGGTAAVIYYTRFIKGGKYAEFDGGAYSERKSSALYSNPAFPIKTSAVKYASTVPMLIAAGYMLYLTAQYIGIIY